MNLKFFASRTISLYMSRLFVVRSLSVLAGLVLILMTLDLLGESGDVLAYPGNGDAQLWYYVSLRAPQLVARFLPFAVLLGTLITLATLNQNSEVIAMKAAGVSAHQILAPLVLASVVIAALSFGFNDRIVTRATATLTAWQQVKYGPVPPSRDAAVDVWVRINDDLIHVDQAIGRGAATKLQGITYYDRNGPSLTKIVHSDSAVQVPGGWQLRGANEFDVTQGVMRRLPDMIVGKDITADRFTLSSVDGDSRSFGALATAIADLKAAGRPTASLETVLWHKISGPMSSILMPLLAGVAGFGLARSGKLFIRAVIGMGLGFAYFVADNFGLAMGNLGAYPPILAAWAPFVLFLLIGETVLIRTEE
ncbi:LPS export ABC transporter permease LptG [Sphingomonas naphthae]|uniref:LPS export ABC transporter permease LptG n=1 Tax=Sphingomonas naphthae TaxID=1813468 RepID=A0ABY7TIT6_9SPHN|nr:LPS export ABC transporter permease LptG [Sphingomonas naphthae]WCT72840.1 LPS export ABC transporter permease LptG [Sphingomonas naphthae]